MKKYYLLIALLIWTFADASATIFPSEDKQREIFTNNSASERDKIKSVYSEKMRKQTEGLEITSEEKLYFDGYTVDSNSYINNYLKDGAGSSAPESIEVYQAKIKNFSETMNKFPPSNSNIYRGSSSTRSSGNGKPYYDLDGEVPGITEGDFIVTDKFTSFSYSFEEASDFSRTGAVENDIGVIFGVENSANSVPIAPYSVEDEAEALTKPGQIYRVKKTTSYKGFIDDDGIEKRMVTVELTEQEMVPEDAKVFFMSEGSAINKEKLEIFKERLGADNEHLIPDSLKNNINVGGEGCAP
ncbi:hypothetical protein BTHERMOSOX_366 [Bathymodiolus thermophilus thioautotrophic gill symbiont]|uniref:ADP-ribosyltransferase n=1 Tax=Bathymodiolus thermophilus thioautotrophic gill symbiont TaxID=2360 RepID=UPI0010B1F062|nr:ADP-ribosyltransferase [Bathymodiolus thermophilus thioautotrophic gill symbiont]SHA10521.1 hypothetical protein BTHERMOSOX_366 [Bathymodiolus thermophilus thioautotrophic gill symbiont]